jgi:hypothetical protein
MVRSSEIKAALRPLPMRITPLQYERLLAARIKDGRTIQEHVRKSLDLYLDGLDRQAARTNGGTVPTPQRPPEPPSDRPKVGAVVQRAVAKAKRGAPPTVRQR